MSWKFLCSLVGLLSVGTMSAADTQYGAFTVRTGKEVDPFWDRAVNYGVNLGFSEQGGAPSGVLYAGALPQIGKGGEPALILGLTPDKYAKAGFVGVPQSQFAAGVADYVSELHPRGIGFVNDGSQDAKALQKQIKGGLSGVRTVDYAWSGLAKRLPQDQTSVIVVCGTPKELNQRRSEIIDFARSRPGVTFLVADPDGAFGALPPEGAGNIVIGQPLLNTDIDANELWSRITPAAAAKGFPAMPAIAGYSAATVAARYPEPFTPGIAWYQGGRIDVVPFSNQNN